jgi:hypothetical protein
VETRRPSRIARYP